MLDIVYHKRHLWNIYDSKWVFERIKNRKLTYKKYDMGGRKQDDAGLEHEAQHESDNDRNCKIIADI